MIIFIGQIKRLPEKLLTTLIWIIALAAVSCSSFSSRKPLRIKQNIVLYALDANDYPNAPDIKEQLLPIQKIPPLTNDSLKAVMGNLEYSKKTTWGDIKRRIYSEGELDELVRVVGETLPELKENQRLVIISRFDLDKSVLSRMERVTALLWADKEYLNLVFGEIHQPIPHNDHLEYDKWTENILPVSLRRAFPWLAISPEDYFTFNKINGTSHDTWIKVPLTELTSLSYKPVKKKDTSDFVMDKKERQRRILEDAYEENLLTKEDFEKKLKSLEKPNEKSEESSSKKLVDTPDEEESD